MPFEKGNKKGKGRTGPNKFTASAKDAFAQAFVGIGGVKALTAWAKTNKDEFFKLYARLIPVELAGEVKTDNHVHITREVITKVP